MVKHCSQALYDGLLAGIKHFTSSDLKDIHDCAIAEARLRILQEAEMRGEASACDVTAAFHMARKTKRIVERIARRSQAKGRWSK